jgi:hypothetical protein
MAATDYTRPDLGTPCHIGIVVPNLEAAKSRLSGTAGHRWVDTFAGEMPVLLGDQRHRIVTRVAWSVEGPCHLELIEAVPETLWSARGEMYLHHFGYWVQDIDNVSRRLEVTGMPVEVRYDNDSERRDVFVYHKGDDGLRIELGGQQQRELVRSKIADWHRAQTGQETESG